MRNICFVTATRAEYGLLKWLMKEIKESREFELQLVVTGAHLLEEQGHTIDIITADGFNIDEIVDVRLNTFSMENIAESMGRMAQLFAHTFARICPDYVVVLGDRYELLPIVNTAFVMRIPIIHLSGGDVTEGAIDDGIRNAITMMADYHFPGTKNAADNIARMRGSNTNIWAVGEPGLDSFYREKLLNRDELASDLDLCLEKKWALFTFHAETKKSLDYNIQAVKNCISILSQKDGIQIVATYSNTDFGGKAINDYLENVAKDNPDIIKVVPSLGNKRYLSFMRQASLVIGNSSSGIIEAPTLGVPVINIGERQRGRYQCKNIIQTGIEKESIDAAIKKAMCNTSNTKDYYWGDGHTSERIYSILRNEIIKEGC